MNKTLKAFFDALAEAVLLLAALCFLFAMLTLNITLFAMGIVFIMAFILVYLTAKHFGYFSKIHKE